MTRDGGRALTALDWIGVAVALLAIAYLSAFPFAIAPVFRRLLEDLGGTVPALTQLALAWWFPLALAVAPAATLVAAAAAGPSLARRRAIIAASFAEALLFAAMLHYALYLPLFALDVR